MGEETEERPKTPFKNGHPNPRLVVALVIAGFLLAVLTLFLAIILLLQPCCNIVSASMIETALAVCGFIWCIAPPIWFWWEYHRCFMAKGDPEGFEAFKYSQQLSIAVWAGLIVFFGIVLAMAS